MHDHLNVFYDLHKNDPFALTCFVLPIKKVKSLLAPLLEYAQYDNQNVTFATVYLQKSLKLFRKKWH